MTSLSGKRILITRPENQAAGITSRLITLGATPVIFPTIEVKPDPTQQSLLKQAIERLDHFDWLIFTSQNAVNFFWEQYENAHPPPEALANLQIAAVGPATARALSMRGISVALMPDTYVGEAVAGVIENLDGKRVLVPRALTARPELIENLVHKGALVEEIPLYQTVTSRPGQDAWRELNKGIDIFTFTSASTVRAFIELLGGRARTMLLKGVSACIGPITASVLEEYGIHPEIVSRSHTSQGLVQAILDHAQNQKPEETR